MEYAAFQVQFTQVQSLYKHKALEDHFPTGTGRPMTL